MNTKKIKILLVDYDKMMSIYFRDIFWIHGRSEDYDVLIASSLEEADKKIEDKETRPDTIFLDVMMPVEGQKNSPSEQIKRSVAFIEKIKKDKELSHIKIIIYSSQKEECLKDEISKIGVDGYLVKGDLMPKEIIDFTDKIHESNN